MAGEHENQDVVCGCDRVAPVAEAQSCGCAPNVAFTCQEEAILGKMREMKSEVRNLANRMKEIRNSMDEHESMEWVRLSSQLEEMRSQWKVWETKLDDAIERKLILLGHREMQA
ncbi:MAG TPA: hypothetical protein VK463_05690 [Desulfomonilaceae bacterium]|nr:hypothetical protein [Desulfomonilaceae bacterium]